MKKIGIAASTGYAIGTVFIKDSYELSIAERYVENVDAEVARLNNAVYICESQIKHIKERMSSSFSDDKVAIFRSHLLLLHDPEFIGSIEQEIRLKKINAEKATKNILDKYIGIFNTSDNQYMRERAEDIKDISLRILGNLCGHKSKGLKELNYNTILVASDLTPSDTVELDKERVIAFLTNVGGGTSHSAIIARSLEIPAVVGLKDITRCVKQGDIVIVDGQKGEVIINPDQSTIEEYEDKKRAFEEEKCELKKLVNIKSITSYGKTIEVAANVGSVEEVDKALESGADGIGLFRTEFLFMNRSAAPSEEEQFKSYKHVLEKMSGKPVIFRTLDLGADKKVPYLRLQGEANPFLGYRAIRLSLGRKDIFKTQLKALLRASVYGNLKIMFPLISNVEEITSAKDILNECKKELTSVGYAYKNIQVGIMVEVPAAGLMSEELAQHVDFLSIGTNDLIQYTLAADRMNEKISYLYNPTHSAVIKLIKMTVDGAHKAGKWCGICGEMAGYEQYIPLLIQYGLDELSVGVPSVLKVKKAISSL